MKLHYKKLGEGKPLIILHGLMGMLDNWLTPARKLSESYEVYLVDLRNHGHSPHSNEHTYQVMADDLAELIDDLLLPEVFLLGHSMGGKVAMLYAQQNPETVEKLVVADIAPKQYPVHHEQILKGLSAIDLDRIKSRKEAEKVLQEYISDIGIRQFLLKNLHWKEKGQLAWRFNLDAIRKNIENMGESTDDWMFGKPTLFIKGGNSDYIKSSDEKAIRIVFPEAEFVTISGAGHWLHAEKSQEFLEAVIDFLEG